VQNDAATEETSGHTRKADTERPQRKLNEQLKLKTETDN